MKRTILFLALLSAYAMSFAQQYQQDTYNPHMLKFPLLNSRTEIVLPEVNGYKVIKADLHVHTIYSDGCLTSSSRISEAWQDGLDAIAMTDHIEYRPHEKEFAAFLNEGVKVKEVKKGKIAADLNYSISAAKSKAKHLGLTLIPGAEITRNPVEIGHFNCLFTTDNNLIYDPDPLTSIRNARKQGCIIQHNHPGWVKKDNSFTSVAKEALKEGLIDGVEVFNSWEFYPDVIEEAEKQGLYMCSGSDIHKVSQDVHGAYNVFHDMTLILAKDASLASIREGLEAKRTLAYAYGNLAGSESMLQDFFKASFSFETVYTQSNGTKEVKITNNTSFTYIINFDGGLSYTVKPFSSFISTTKDGQLSLKVMNMWYGVDKHPVIKVTV